MKTPTKHQRISKIALLTCLLTLAGCASGHESDIRQSGSAVSPEDKAVQLVGYCQRLQQEGDLANAAAFCNRALEYDPTNEIALLSMARILEERKAPREAGQAYRAILVLDPENVEARYGLGKTYIALEQYKLAREQLEMALKAGSDARIYNTLGVVNDQLGEHEAAQKAYRRGLGSDSDSIPLRTNLGLSLVLSGRHGEGLLVLREAAANPAAGSDTRQALTFAYAIAGDMTAAEEMALVDLPPDVARSNLAYYQGLRDSGVGTPPPPPAEPTLAEALESEPMDAPMMASSAVPIFDPEVATAIALADAEDRQRPWTEWGQLPDYGTTVAQLQTLHDSTAQQPRTLIGQSPAEGQQLAMADDSATDASPGIETSALPEQEDPYLSSLERLLNELPPEETGAAQPGSMESMEAEAMPGMEEPARMDKPMMAEPQMAEGKMADSGAMAPKPPMLPAEKTMGEKAMAGKPQMADAGMMAQPEMTKPEMTKPEMAKPQMAKGPKTYSVQLGSFRSPEQAAKGWVQLQSSATDLLGDMDPVFTKADLGQEKGVFYRLRTQPNAKASAKELCGALSKRGIDCLVVKAEAPQVAKTASSG